MRIHPYISFSALWSLSIFLTAAGSAMALSSREEARIHQAILYGKGIEEGSPFRRLVIHIGGTGSQTCTGILLNERFVLTAAHCLVNQSTVNVAFLDGSKQAVTALALSHPEYRKFPLRKQPNGEVHHANKYDIGLLRLETPAPFPLPFAVDFSSELRDFSSGKLILLGTGTDEQMDRNAEAYLEVPGQAGKVVFTEFEDYPKLEITANGGTCMGDSGGPTLFKQNERYILVGIHSQANCSSWSLDEFVPFHSDWIKGGMKQLEGMREI